MPREKTIYQCPICKGTRQVNAVASFKKDEKGERVISALYCKKCNVEYQVVKGYYVILTPLK